MNKQFTLPTSRGPRGPKRIQQEKFFPTAHMILICDRLRLSDALMEAYQRQIDHNHLRRQTWEELLADSKSVHDEFIRARRPH
jgi:hypothetical protein